MQANRRGSAVLISLSLFLATMASPVFAQGASNFTPEWVQRSNEIAYKVLETSAKFAPEFSGQMGVDGLDEEIFDLKANLYERQMAVEEEKIAYLTGLLLILLATLWWLGWLGYHWLSRPGWLASARISWRA